MYEDIRMSLSVNCHCCYDQHRVQCSLGLYLHFSWSYSQSLIVNQVVLFCFLVYNTLCCLAGEHATSSLKYFCTIFNKLLTGRKKEKTDYLNA